MFDDYGSIIIKGQSVSIEKLTIEELEEYLKTLNQQEKELIAKQNEYLSKLIDEEDK